jgi:hypothetical protein
MKKCPFYTSVALLSRVIASLKFEKVEVDMNSGDCIDMSCALWDSQRDCCGLKQTGKETL